MKNTEKTKQEPAEVESPEEKDILTQEEWEKPIKERVEVS